MPSAIGTTGSPGARLRVGLPGQSPRRSPAAARSSRRGSTRGARDSLGLPRLAAITARVALRPEGRERGGEALHVLETRGRDRFSRARITASARGRGRSGRRSATGHGRVRDDGREDGRRALGDEGRLPGEELVEHDAERPDVGAAVDVLGGAHLLGRHVERRPEGAWRSRSSSRDVAGRAWRCRSRAP